jgi:L-iditol 2-dehydrogenase
MNDMQAAFLYAKEDIRLERTSLPEMESQGLLIRVLTCGICGSDSRMFFTGPTPRYINPVILGHEICGEVVEVGPDVTDYRPGDLVGIAPIIPCMHCHACSHGQDNICATAKVIGCTVHGAMGEYMYIPSQMVQVGGAVKLPAGAGHRDASQAELVGCVLHGLRQVGIEVGDQVLVIGGGPIGLTFVQMVKLLGAKVTTSELSPRRREMAREMGAVEAVDPASVDLKSRYGYAFDRVIVAAASVPATAQAFDLVRTGGSLLFFSGYLKGSTLEMQLNDLHYRELHIHGSIDCTIRDYQNAVSLLPQLRMGNLITDVFSLGSTVDAFYATRNPDAIKVVIEP